MGVSSIVLFVIAALLILFFVKRFIQRSHMTEYSVSEVAEKLNGSSAILLDVRTQEERNHGAIQGSLHIPLGELSEKSKVLERHRQKEIICYCRSGRRSIAAVSILQKNGFNAVNMKGGIIEWNSLKLKL
jgi:rhodanese-related sulfurtransferase